MQSIRETDTLQQLDEIRLRAHLGKYRSHTYPHQVDGPALSGPVQVVEGRLVVPKGSLHLREQHWRYVALLRQLFEARQLLLCLITIPSKSMSLPKASNRFGAVRHVSGCR